MQEDDENVAQEDDDNRLVQCKMNLQSNHEYLMSNTLSPLYCL
ncbi:unnamed protein product, partial [Urochloa humidicola]